MALDLLGGLGFGGGYGMSFVSPLADKLVPGEQTGQRPVSGNEEARSPFDEGKDEEKRIEMLQKMGITVPGHPQEKESEDGKVVVKNPGESTEKIVGKKSSPAECQTCAERKYQDGSDEMVSFKSASHISPEAAATRVMAHEMEHVSNAYAKATQGEGKVLQASVTLKTSVCPECGRVYVSGGVTHTKIAYSNEDQPYQKQLKAFQEDALKGSKIDVRK